MKSHYLYAPILLSLLAGGCISNRQNTDEQTTSQSTALAGDTLTAGKPPEPEWARNATIYEVNVRQFSAKGDLASVETQLPRLKELGVDIVWLMPIYPVGKVYD